MRFYPRIGSGHFLLLFAALLPCGSGAAPVDYRRDVRPILAARCFACHGPDAAHRMANLRLDTVETFRQKRGAEPLVAPGDPQASLLYRRISAPDPGQRMPPAASGVSLTTAEKETLRQWIVEGAKAEEHWAYIAPRRPELPSVNLRSWPRNTIDYFILSRLEKEGLKPSPEADKATLLRRVSFDLTGLPPTLQELEDFLADSSSDAYEKAVDRQLASPHYGERMAVQWLDEARYADTNGYQVDAQREMWPWRDWVIHAFNANMPFDQFTIEQLAGDLLPNATIEQRIATGFNRNHMINAEGGALDEEFQPEYMADRVEATATVWLGSTLACARCHDHKFDPFSQRDYYRFGAYFNTISEKGVDGAYGNAAPILRLPSKDQQAAIDKMNQTLYAVQPKISEETLGPMLAEWEKNKPAKLPPAPRQGLLSHHSMDGSLSDLSGNYRHARLLKGEIEYRPSLGGHSAWFNGATRMDTGVTLPAAFSIALWAKSDGQMRMTLLANTENATLRRGFEALLDESIPMPEESDRGAHLIFRLVNRSPDDLIEIRTRDRLKQKDWRHIVFAYDGSGKASGAHVFVDGRAVECQAIHDSLSGSPVSAQPIEIGNPEVGAPYKGELRDLRIYSRPLTQDEAEILAEDEPVRAMLMELPASRSKEEKEALRQYFLAQDAPPELHRMSEEFDRLMQERAAVERKVPTVMVMSEMEKPRETFVLGRGDYRNKLEKVTAGVPGAIAPAPPADAPANRLTLARWLVDPANPLTARVTVNTYWSLYFGTGLVKTAEDFGSQGEAPSHPELLDWLATEFVRSGWNVKAMQRLIVTSAAYRQASAASPDLQRKDPENRLLARGPHYRLPAEMIRDNALAASGLLNREIGGPSVFPYQAPGVWEELTTGDIYSAQTYTQSHGADLYRRTMYTFWKRTAPPPSIEVLDAPDRGKCTMRRSLTNTPMQALVLMNDPTYVEAARELASRVIKEAGPDANQRADLAFRLAVSRAPSPAEKRVLLDLFTRSLAKYRADPQSARKLLTIGESKSDEKLDTAELAAWTTVASVILNLDETVTKD
jgi:Protein of unknown function (DUF1553)/Protein of unknown function (DUF1549)/Planctomycete cytochrome C/Concanavalin A-like lectin/glucanases superfamily